MTLKFSFFYKHSNKDYFLGLLQKVANAHSVEIRAEVRDEILCVFASAENAEILGAFVDTLESEIPLSLYFRLKSVELYEKPLSAEKVAQNLENIFSISEINTIKNPSDSRFCDIFGDSMQSTEFSNKNSASAHRISPDSWCKKSESKDAVVPSADFLLESGKRGTPPKSEKAAAFWRVGGAGRGVQPFLRKEKGESKGKEIIGDSQIAKMDSSRCRAQNDESVVDCFGNESPRNDESFVDCHDSPNAKSRNDKFIRLDSPTSLKNALTNLCDLLSKGQNITLSTSKGNISLSTKSDDFDFILANDISTISLYTRASADELNALASFEKPLLSLNIKEVFAREVGAKTALFILPYDIILCCISSILLNREIAFVYGKKIDSANLNLVYNSTHKSDFFEIIVGQNGYFLNKNFLDLSANPNGKKLSNLWDFLDFSFDNFKGESIKSNSTPHSPSLRGDLSPKQSTQNSDIFIAYLSTKNPTRLANLRTKAQIIKIAFDKNPKNIFQKITTLENGDKLIANFKKEFEARFMAIQSLDSASQMSENIMDIFECAAMILGQKRDKNAIFNLANSYLRDIGPKIDFKNVSNSSLDSHNSPLELHFADSANFGHSQTSSLASRPKFAENYESQTENSSVVLNARNSKSMQDAPKSKLQTSDLIYDESRTIRSIISFTLAGSEPEVIAFGIIESLVDYLILIFRDAQKQFETKNMGIIGDIFANKIFFDKITQKIPKDFNLMFPKFLDIQ